MCLTRQSPIQESLIDFSDSGMNRVAADIFVGEWRVKERGMDVGDRKEEGTEAINDLRYF